MDAIITETRTLTQRAGAALTELFQEARDRPVLFLASGGSSLGVLDHVVTDLLPRALTVAVVDERYSSDPTVNTFAQLMATDFYAAAVRQGARFIDTRIRNNEDMDALAMRWEASLREWREAHRDGVVIATLGIGADGHTAGIMPYPDDPAYFAELFDSERWVVAYDAGDKNQYPLRITTTFPFLRTLDHVVVFMAGDAKRDAYDKLEAQEGPLAETPARIVHDLLDVTVFTDLG